MTWRTPSLIAGLGAALLLGAPIASAQEPAPEPPPDPDAAASPLRFRGGIGASVGGLFHGDFALGVGGWEARLGVQISDPFAVYLQPFFGFYWGVINGRDGNSPMGGASALVDYTFGDRGFVAGGVGVARFDEPIGATLHFRGGGYPWIDYGDDGVRRKALMVGAELRLFVVSETVLASPTFAVGYEAF